MRTSRSDDARSSDRASGHFRPGAVVKFADPRPADKARGRPDSCPRDGDILVLVKGSATTGVFTAVRLPDGVKCLVQVQELVVEASSFCLPGEVRSLLFADLVRDVEKRFRATQPGLPLAVSNWGPDTVLDCLSQLALSCLLDGHLEPEVRFSFEVARECVRYFRSWSEG